jgi:hypothetical protein
MAWSDPLVVAVVGIIAAGLVQACATRKAHEYALHLFERQATDQAEVRGEDREEQRRGDHLADKRTAYVAMIRALTEYGDNQEVKARRLASQATDATSARPPEDQAATDAFENRQRSLRDEVHRASVVIRLLAPTRVSDASWDWLKAVLTRASDVDAKRQAFIALAQEDLG